MNMQHMDISAPKKTAKAQYQNLFFIVDKCDFVQTCSPLLNKVVVAAASLFRISTTASLALGMRNR